MTNSNMCMD